MPPMRTLRILAFLAGAFLAWAAVAEDTEPVKIEDTRGSQIFETVPERVVVLTWSLAEQILELGVTPVGMADMSGYQAWVVRPPMPESTAEVGLRHAPNFERIAELEPDLILVGDLQVDFTPQLERIGRVLEFRLFDEAHDNAATARRVFLDLARIFRREGEAEARLATADARIALLGERVAEAYGGAPPKVALIRIADATNLRVYGENSMAEAALHALGLENAWPQARSRWGLTTRPIIDLGTLEDGHVLYIEPFEEADRLFASPIWQAMPVVEAGKVSAMAATWTYGGALSVGYLAEAIAESLLAAAP
ncbi:MAG: iron-siderophore ABC transporter substrate-binding protein [Pseudomonadota bacterium]